MIAVATLEVDAVRTFLAVADHASFTRAAEALGTTVEIPITDLAATLLGYDVASTKWASEVVDWQLLSGYRLPRVMAWSLEGASAWVVLTQLSFPEPGSG